MRIPIIYYPITILCIDDDSLMLDILKNNLGESYPLKFVSSSENALKLLNAESTQNTTSQTFLKNVISNGFDELVDLQLNIKLKKLSELLNVQSKSSEIGILIIDYNLPGMNGIEFCLQLKDSNYKKIILTEHHDYQIVLSACNSNTIDAFFLKSDRNLFNQLFLCIQNLTREYFLNITQLLQSCIETRNKLPLSDNRFNSLFFEIIEKMGMVHK